MAGKKLARQAPCGACTRPSGVGFALCASCGDRLARQLLSVPDLWNELTNTYARWDDLGIPMGRGGEMGVLFSPAASAALNGLESVVVYWAQVLADKKSSCWMLPDTLTEVTSWLHYRLDWLRALDCAGQAYDELDSAILRAWSVVDRPMNRTSFYVGPCVIQIDGNYCPGEIWAHVPLRIGVDPAVLRCRYPECIKNRDPYTTDQWLRAGELILRRKMAMLRATCAVPRLSY